MPTDSDTGVDNAFDDITMFDNHVLDVDRQPTPGCAANCSRGLRIRLDHTEKTFSLVHEFYHSASVQTWAQGGYQTLPNDNVMIGWGTVPAITEFTPAGKAVQPTIGAPEEARQSAQWHSTRYSGSPATS